MAERGIGAQERGRDRMDGLLRDAEAILAAEGYATLTLRRLANDAGMHLSNVQHYFPTRAALVEALLARLEARVGERLDARWDDHAPPMDQLLAAIDALVDNVTDEGFIPVWELWSMARRDPDAAVVMEGVYRRLMGEFTALVSAAMPRLSAAECRDRARLVVGLAEGVGFLVAPGGPDRDARPSLRTLLRAGMIALAVGESPP